MFSKLFMKQLYDHRWAAGEGYLKKELRLLIFFKVLVKKQSSKNIFKQRKDWFEIQIIKSAP